MCIYLGLQRDSQTNQEPLHLILSQSLLYLSVLLNKLFKSQEPLVNSRSSSCARHTTPLASCFACYQLAEGFSPALSLGTPWTATAELRAASRRILRRAGRINALVTTRKQRSFQGFLWQRACQLRSRGGQGLSQTLSDLRRAPQAQEPPQLCHSGSRHPAPCSAPSATTASSLLWGKSRSWTTTPCFFFFQTANRSRAQHRACDAVLGRRLTMLLCWC